MAAFIGVPVAEIYVLIKVGDEVGVLNTIGLVIITALIGAALVRSQGLATLSRIQAGLQQGQAPGLVLVEGALILFAGALLLTPGFITDAIGFFCLIPTTRRWLASLVAKYTIVKATQASRRGAGPTSNSSSHGSGVIDGEFSREQHTSRAEPKHNQR
ncbi:MAG: hypothetical protein GKR94_26865 [Gammaproteobacteria bacterium]|nr:hypothetical protein [Gammaproteobacteria bacterium]